MGLASLLTVMHIGLGVLTLDVHASGIYSFLEVNQFLGKLKSYFLSHVLPYKNNIRSKRLQLVKSCGCDGY